MTSAYAYFEGLYRQDPAAPGWNSPSVDQQVRGWLDELLHRAALTPPARLLEIGCGMGNLTHWLARQGFLMTGIDISATAIASARARIPQDGGKPPVFAEGDITQHGVLATCGPVDAVVDGLCLHCILGADRSRLLACIRGALGPGGCFLVMTMCGEPRSADLRKRFDASTRCIHGATGPQRYLGRPAELMAELAEYDFEVGYSRVQTGDDATGDQDMLLAVAWASATA